jgi:hypothetical protein
MASESDAQTGDQIPRAEEFEAVEVPIGAAEPWESWETKLCLWSLAIGIVGLVILGALVNAFIL